MQRGGLAQEVAEQGQEGAEEIGALEGQCKDDFEDVDDGFERGRYEAVECSRRTSAS